MKIDWHDDSLFLPIDIWQLLLDWLRKGTVEFPIRCAECGSKTKGNRIIGYRMGCNH